MTAKKCICKAKDLHNQRLPLRGTVYANQRRRQAYLAQYLHAVERGICEAKFAVLTVEIKAEIKAETERQKTASA